MKDRDNDEFLPANAPRPLRRPLIPLLTLEQFRRYTIREVAELLPMSESYLWECIRAGNDEDYRRRRGIPATTLRTLPVRHWYQQGRRWVIKAADLLTQL